MAASINLKIRLDGCGTDWGQPSFLEELSMLEERFVVAMENIRHHSSCREQLQLELCARAVVVATTAELCASSGDGRHPKCTVASAAGKVARLSLGDDKPKNKKRVVRIAVQHGSDCAPTVMEAPHSEVGGCCLGIWIERYHRLTSRRVADATDGEWGDVWSSDDESEETADQLERFLLLEDTI